MSDLDRDAAWRSQTDPIYKAIGEFVVTFELLGLAMSLCIKAILERSGLRNEHVSDILLAGITAEPLRTLLESLASETGWLRSEDKATLRDVLSRFQKLTAERNDIVHGAWLIELSNYSSHQTDFSKAMGIKFHKNKEGAANKTLERTVESLNASIAEAIALRASVHKLLGKFIFDSSGKQHAFLPRER